MRVVGAIAVAAVLATLGTVGVTAAAQASDLSSQADRLRHDVASAQADELAAQSTAWDALILATNVTHDVKARQSVIAVRPAFTVAVQAAAAAIAAANGKVDTTSAHDAVIGAQNAVLAETAVAANVTAQTAAVTKIAADLNAAVAAYDAAQAAARPRPAPRPDAGGSPGSNWFADMRQRLDNVGGGAYALVEYDGTCGARWAVACSHPDGQIFVNSGIASWSDSRKNWAMVHELAHQYQYRVWSAMTSSPGYAQLFGSNPETLANCMAAARGYYSGCSSEQLSWATAIWNGNVPS